MRTKKSLKLAGRFSLVSETDYVFLIILLVLVYISGMFIPLMDNDSVQFAGMSMRMVQTGDYTELIKGYEPYLDKPHMHFWLSAISFKVFGISDWAYRLPSILFTLLGAYATYGLGRSFFSKQTGILSALIFLTAQSIILANHDVRTDAVLTGAVVYATWQLLEYLKGAKLKNVVLGAIGLAIGFSTKGQIAVFTCGIFLLVYLFVTSKWKVLFSRRSVVGVIVFLLFITPVLLSYYRQFDLNPGLEVNDSTGQSGIAFILLGQSIERLAGQRGLESNSDFFFLFHSFLWVFLPWAFITVCGLVYFFKRIPKDSSFYLKKPETIFILGTLIVLIVFSFSSFKLPHYLNILLPFCSIVTAWYLTKLKVDNNTSILKSLYYLQIVVGILLLILLSWLTLIVFPVESVFLMVIYLLFIASLVYLVVRINENYYKKVILLSAGISLVFNFILNTNHYPQLLKYQGGSELAKLALNHHIDFEKVYYLNNQWSRSFNYYTRHHLPSLNVEEAEEKYKKGEEFYIMTYDKGKRTLFERGISANLILSSPEFHVAKLKFKFLNPSTRSDQLDSAYLFKIN